MWTHCFILSDAAAQLKDSISRCKFDGFGILTCGRLLGYSKEFLSL